MLNWESVRNQGKVWGSRSINKFSNRGLMSKFTTIVRVNQLLIGRWAVSNMILPEVIYFMCHSFILHVQGRIVTLYRQVISSNVFSVALKATQRTAIFCYAFRRLFCLPNKIVFPSDCLYPSILNPIWQSVAGNRLIPALSCS